MECTGLSKTYIEKNLLQEHDTWLTPEEAKQHKIVDEIVETIKSRKLNKNKKKKIVYKEVKGK
jgi:ATP-dependent protease ClpP protease subunit